jgi:IrrE N-terminal-like domain
MFGYDLAMLGLDELADVEGDAAALFSKAGFDTSDTPSPATLSRALLGTTPQYAPIRTQATLARVKDSWRIFVRRGTPAPRSRWLACHELAHWWYRQLRYSGEGIEARCDALGAALVAPRRAFRLLSRRLGHDHRALAAKIKSTESLALLRLAEVTGAPTVLIRAAGPIVRGEPFAWPVALHLRAVRRVDHHAVERVDIHDEPSRVGIRAA